MINMFLASHRAWNCKLSHYGRIRCLFKNDEYEPDLQLAYILVDMTLCSMSVFVPFDEILFTMVRIGTKHH